jgi:diguanylate cyclase (GGDEF)-like protein
VRGKGTLSAIGFPVAAALSVGVWLHTHGTGISADVTAGAVLVLLTALSGRIEVVTSPRIHLSAAAGFLVAAALVGGPVVGAVAGISIEATLPVQEVWRKRCAWGGAAGLTGLVVGLLGAHLHIEGAGGAFAVAVIGLLAGFILNLAWMVVISYDRRIHFGPELRQAWRPILLASLVIPVLPLTAFLYVFASARWLALAFAAAALLALWLGNRVRLRLERRLAQERLRAHHDALTGAPNRYALGDALAAEHARIKRGGRTAAICFIDLDRFKRVNDTFGYAAGDQLLAAFYERLRARLRAMDLVFRWGGEEFVLLAPHIDEPELADVAERLRVLVANEPFTVKGRPRQITCSVGAALLDEWREPDEVLETAARLVRLAKSQRNNVEVERRSPKLPAPLRPDSV